MRYKILQNAKSRTSASSLRSDGQGTCNIQDKAGSSGYYIEAHNTTAGHITARYLARSALCRVSCVLGTTINSAMT